MLKSLSWARSRALLLLGASVVATSLSPAALAEVVNGTGTALITKDVEAVRTAATRDAKRAAVRAMLSSVIGSDRMREISVQQLDELAAQIRPDMIVNQTADRSDKNFSITLAVEFDTAQFSRRLDDMNIRSSADLGNAQNQLMAVYLTMSEGTASDFSQPAETSFEYDSSKGSSYSDRSAVAASSREASADSYRSASGSSRSAAGGYSNRYGSGAASGRSSSASTTRSSSASSSSASYAQQNNVQAHTHDDVRIRHRVVYQQPPKSLDGDAIVNGLTSNMRAFGVQTANAWPSLSDAFPDGVPTYEQLKQDGRYNNFLSGLRARNTPFFMGGFFSITHNGRDMSGSGMVSCTGNLNASAFTSDTDNEVASGQFSAAATGQNPQHCSGQLTTKLAELAASKMGPDIQRHWRAKARNSVGQNSREEANYRLVLRSQSLDMEQQQALIEALEAVNGASVESFVNSSNTQMELIVRYSGTLPLQFPLFSSLKNKTGFGQMQTKVDGRSIMLCLSACGF